MKSDLISDLRLLREIHTKVTCEVTPELETTIERFAEHYAAQARGRYLGYFAIFTETCESPIEFTLAAAILSLSYNYPPLKCQFFGNYSINGPSCHLLDDTINFGCQVHIGEYRVDFLAEASFDGNSSLKVAIECDGHDYHEKTKEQAARDKQRDRWMQSKNIYVLRFTGSEIWRDPEKCATQIFDFIFDKIYPQ